jgi:hypothetical protein
MWWMWTTGLGGYPLDVPQAPQGIATGRETYGNDVLIHVVPRRVNEKVEQSRFLSEDPMTHRNVSVYNFCLVVGKDTRENKHGNAKEYQDNEDG